MTDRQAKHRTLQILHQPYYARICDLSRLEFNVFKIVGENVLKFNIVDRDWHPVRTQDARDDVRARCEQIHPQEAARIIGWHFI